MIAVGDGFLVGDTIGSVEAFEGVNDVVDADGDELGLGNNTPSNEMPFTSSFTTNCGSPVDEFSVTNELKLIPSYVINLHSLTLADDFKLHPVQHCRSKIFQSILLLVMSCMRTVMATILDVWRIRSIN